MKYQEEALKKTKKKKYIIMGIIRDGQLSQYHEMNRKKRQGKVL